MKKKGIKELSVDAQEIYRRLVKMEEGEFISYAELSDIIGRPFTEGSARQYYYTARDMALRENRMVFVTVRDEGIKRLENESIPDTIGSDAITSIRRKTKRSAKQIAAADYDTLSDPMKIRHNTTLSVLGAFMQMTKQKSIALIDEGVKLNDLNPLTYARALEQFKRV